MIRATTIRRLQSESSTGSSTSQRVRLNLTITVESVDFDPIVGLLRINGRVSSESPYVKVKKKKKKKERIDSMYIEL
jgi:protein pelota